ncbi:M23 family metallopeptidase [Candidatus Woesearchaeota archaeon]|nr:M23 family metallopeptidase [Candidatus Woesearchaeota archaeon]
MVVAAAPGKVMPIQRDPSNDEYGVLIDHANGYGSSYTHMDNPADMPNPIKVGQKIERGQIIGKFKRYGLGGGHVHFAVMFINDGELGYGTMGPYRRISQPVSQYNQNLWLDDRGRENCPHYAGETDAQDCIGDFWPPYTATATPSSTSSPTQVATYTPTTPPTATPNFTATPSQTGTPTATSSPTAVATFTPTGTPSPTPNFTPTPTPTNTPTSTPAQATPEPVVCGAGGRVVQKATGQQTCQYFANVPVVLNYTSGNQNIAVTGATTAAYTSAAADYRISATRPALR